MKNNNNNSRRNFIKNSAIVGLGVASAKKTFSIGKKKINLKKIPLGTMDLRKKLIKIGVIKT